MTPKDHYDTHLGNFYAWMLEPFEDKKNEFLQWCRKQSITPNASKFALDLGSGHGIQSIALAELGFYVKAIDFSSQLLAELNTRKGDLPIETLYADIRDLTPYKSNQPELITCCGDTISHLGSMAEIEQLIQACFDILRPGGKLILSFRNYSQELLDTSRFIPVKSDSEKILTCFLEYFPDKVRVTDILYEKINDQWQQKASSYEKVRISVNTTITLLEKAGFKIIKEDNISRMSTIYCEKPKIEN